jgi:aryl-alcohol dehydrogenase-like predicted oxidoreductase
LRVTGTEQAGDMRLRRIGGRQVGAVGLGAMPMSVREHNDPDLAFATIAAAVEAGVSLVDTADAYSWDEASFGHNEELVAAALRRLGAGDSVLVATKGGHTRRGRDWELDGSPAYLARACRASLRRLGVERIGLYQHHRPDPQVPYEDSIGALRELHDEGLIELAGLSNADPDQIRVAHSILGDALVSVQNEYSPRFRSSEPEIELCEELGLTFLAWSPLGGMSEAGELGTRWQPFADVAAERGVSPQRVALAWELARSECVLPIPGASRPESVRDSAAAADLELDAEALAQLAG